MYCTFKNPLHFPEISLWEQLFWVFSFLSSNVTLTVAKRTASWWAECHRLAFSGTGGAKKGFHFEVNLSYSTAEPSLKRPCFFIEYSITWYKSPRGGQKEKMAVRTPVALNTLDLREAPQGPGDAILRSTDHASHAPSLCMQPGHSQVSMPSSSSSTTGLS